MEVSLCLDKMFALNVLEEKGVNVCYQELTPGMSHPGVISHSNPFILLIRTLISFLILIKGCFFHFFFFKRKGGRVEREKNINARHTLIGCLLQVP